MREREREREREDWHLVLQKGSLRFALCGSNSVTEPSYVHLCHSPYFHKGDLMSLNSSAVRRRERERESESLEEQMKRKRKRTDLIH